MRCLKSAEFNWIILFDWIQQNSDKKFRNFSFYPLFSVENILIWPVLLCIKHSKFYWLYVYVCVCMCAVEQRKAKTPMYENIICFFSFSFITRYVRIDSVRERVGDGGDAQLQGNLSVFLLFSLLSWVLYRAMSRHRTILVSPCFSTFASLVYLRLFSTSQPWAVWRKARPQSDMASSNSLQWYFGLRSSLVVIYYSGRPRKFSWSHLQSAASALHDDITPVLHLRITREHISFQHATHAFFVALPLGATRILFTLETGAHPVMLPSRRIQHFCRGIWVLFTLGNKCISCYATRANYTACQRDLPVNIQRMYMYIYIYIRMYVNIYVNICRYIHVYIYIVNKISCISIQFVKEGNVSKTPHRNRHKPTLLDGCTDWRIIADVDWQLVFPTEITSTRQRPNLVIWSVNSKKVIIAELTIIFEVNIGWVHQRKLDKHKDLCEQCIKNGRSIDVFPLEIGCRGFISNSTSTFLPKLGLSPAKKREYI